MAVNGTAVSPSLAAVAPATADLVAVDDGWSRPQRASQRSTTTVAPSLMASTTAAIATPTVTPRRAHLDAPNPPFPPRLRPDIGGSIASLKRAFPQVTLYSPLTPPAVAAKMPRALMKYWRFRYGLFSRWEEGIVADDEGLFSITPERIALQQALRMGWHVEAKLIREGHSPPPPPTAQPMAPPLAAAALPSPPRTENPAATIIGAEGAEGAENSQTTAATPAAPTTSPRPPPVVDPTSRFAPMSGDLDTPDPTDLSFFPSTPSPLLKDMVAVDLFGGVGGNVIALARMGFRVYSVDMSAVRCAALKHNCRVYGVADRVTVVQRDVVELLSVPEDDTTPGGGADPMRLATRLGLDVPPFIFMSPPWGGPDYISATSFNIAEGLALRGDDGAIRLAGDQVLKRSLAQAIGLMAFIPRNTTVEALNALDMGPCLLEHSHIDGRVKGLSVTWLSQDQHHFEIQESGVLFENHLSDLANLPGAIGTALALANAGASANANVNASFNSSTSTAVATPETTATMPETTVMTVAALNGDGAWAP